MKNHLSRLLLLVLLIFSVNTYFAQKGTDQRLAAQYYADQEYDKAVIYYEKLYNKTHDQNFYSKLLNCFIELKEFKNGERLVKKRIKRFPFKLEFLADLGHLYGINNDQGKANQANDRAIKQLSPDNEQIINLANSFLKYQEPELAIQTYLKGRKLLKGAYPFNTELAQVYNLQGDTEGMLNEYLDLLSYQESYIQSVQNALQTALNPDENGEKKSLLKTLLIKKIQKNPDKKVYSEMLIWVYIQEKNFNGAFLQTKALDKRLKETGKRIISLAKLSYTNKDYQTAIKCYEYVIDKGSKNYYFNTSKMELVNVYRQKVIGAKSYTETDLLKLEEHYKSTLNELGKNATTFPLMQGLAHLQAFYMHNTTSAIDLLKEIAEIPRLKQHNLARTKIELADINLFIGEIWEASLLYSQVEKSFKYDQLGEIAKFKNARISFYTGDFEWAKTQLDVLKASTSKLIANDAMQLSILITDNIILDTNKIPLMLYAQADLLAYQNKNEEALNLLDSLKKGFPYHEIADDILFKRYEINYKQQKYEAAVKNLEQIVADYSYDILADDALYNLAQLYDNQLDDKTKAAEFYKKIMFDYQSSVYGVESRKRYRDIENKDRIFAIGDVPEEVKGYDFNEKNKDLSSVEKNNFFYNIKANGNYKIYNSKRQLMKEGIFEDYKLVDGKWYRYDQEGNLIKIKKYKDGKYIGDEPISEQQN
jgi:tetratricopeptide (TPR) repeat protein